MEYRDKLVLAPMVRVVTSSDSVLWIYLAVSPPGAYGFGIEL